MKKKPKRKVVRAAKVTSQEPDEALVKIADQIDYLCGLAIELVGFERVAFLLHTAADHYIREHHKREAATVQAQKESKGASKH